MFSYNKTLIQDTNPKIPTGYHYAANSSLLGWSLCPLLLARAVGMGHLRECNDRNSKTNEYLSVLALITKVNSQGRHQYLHTGNWECFIYIYFCTVKNPEIAYMSWWLNAETGLSGDLWSINELDEYTAPVHTIVATMANTLFKYLYDLSIAPVTSVTDTAWCITTYMSSKRWTSPSAATDVNPDHASNGVAEDKKKI